MGPWAAALVALCMASPVGAADGVYADLAPSELVRIMSSEGYSVRLEATSGGSPVIWSRLGKIPFGVFFYSCTKGDEPRCGEIQFYAGFRIDGLFPTVFINEWNKTKRFGRAYIDAEGNAAIEMDLDARGTSEVQLRDALEWWRQLVPAFAQFLNDSMKTS